MKYFQNCKTIEEVKKEYKKLAKMLHPDINGQDFTSDFQTMLNEYEKAFEIYKNIHSSSSGETYTKETNGTAQEFAEIINKIIILENITIEVIGSFVWVYGDTYQHKEELKALAFKYASKKKAWYLAPKDYVKVGKKELNFNEMRSLFGSEILKNNISSKVCLVG